MSSNRLFQNHNLQNHNLTDIEDATYKAFSMGEYSAEVLNYLRDNKVEDLFAKMPASRGSIDLTPDLFALDTQKLCEIFMALPDTVNVINFRMEKIKENQLANFKGLFANSGHARGVGTVRLYWDFDRFPSDVLMKYTLSRSIDASKSNFNCIYFNVSSSKPVEESELSKVYAHLRVLDDEADEVDEVAAIRPR